MPARNRKKGATKGSAKDEESTSQSAGPAPPQNPSGIGSGEIEAAVREQAAKESEASGATEQEEVDHEGSEGSYGAPDSAEYKSHFGSGGRQQSSDSEQDFPEQSHGSGGFFGGLDEGNEYEELVPQNVDDNPYEDAMPGYPAETQATQEPLAESGKPIPRGRRSLFAPPVRDQLPGEEGTEGVQIYDPSTNQAVDGKPVPPRTPPSNRLAIVAARQKANAKARKEAADKDILAAQETSSATARKEAAEREMRKNEEDLGSLFVQPGSSGARSSDSYQNAPTMGNDNGKDILRETAEDTKRLKAEETRREAQNPRPGSLTERLGTSVSFHCFSAEYILITEFKITPEIRAWHDFLIGVESGDEGVGIANAAIASLQQPQTQLARENLDPKHRHLVHTQESNKLGTTTTKLVKNNRVVLEEERLKIAGLQNDLAILKSNNQQLVAENKRLKAKSGQKTNSETQKGQNGQRRATAAGTLCHNVSTEILLTANIGLAAHTTRFGKPTEDAVSLAILRAEEGLKYMRASRASKGVVKGDLQAARVAVAEAYTMSYDLDDGQLQGRSLFWIAIVEFYDSNPIAARKAILEAEEFNEWVLPEDERRWLGKWSGVTEENIKPSQKAVHYKDMLDANVPPMTEVLASGTGEDADWEKVKGDESGGRSRRKHGSRIDGVAAKTAETKRSKWDALSYYI
jgi:hypothetical protein